MGQKGGRFEGKKGKRWRGRKWGEYGWGGDVGWVEENVGDRIIHQWVAEYRPALTGQPGDNLSPKNTHFSSFSLILI